MVYRPIQKIVVVVLALMGAVLLGVSDVRAEEMPEYRIQISPTVFDLKLEVGEKVSKTFEVMNTGTKTFAFRTGVVPYGVSNEFYDADYSTSTKYTLLADWAHLSKTEGRLAPGETQEVTVEFDVPEGAAGGGQYALVFAQISAADGEEGIAVTQRVGILTYAYVNGEIRRSGIVSENKIASFLFNPPIQATSIVENNGNIHQNATYILEVSQWPSGEEVYTNAEHPEVKAILPETRYFNTQRWDGAPRLGIFSVKQTVKFGDQESVVEKLVILCPVWFLFIVILMIVCGVFVLVRHLVEQKNYTKELKEER